MDSWTQRTELLTGNNGLNKLRNSSVLIVGLGGVGGLAAEMICRAGVGRMTLIDRDTVTSTNINRQIAALHSTVGQLKTEIIASRLKDINPVLELTVISDWLNEENTDKILDEGKFDFVVDAIDTLSPKVFLIKSCTEKGIRIISSMGSGAKMDPSKVQISDISKTNYCPLAKAVRQRLSKLGIKKGLTVVYSTEESDRNSVILTEGELYKKSTTGTISYMPALFGLYLSSYVIREIIKN
ncbi:MAG TPA: tRNA threonylcarbamoyladenosine dehydratase [Paludibacteraceae bacterium]|nr:tRNA threonylcarbamoyladenosine dehydratase [Paludibacteraceae bacterium]